MTGRIAFVSMGDVFSTPYLSMYETVFDGDYDLIYWQRGSLREVRPRANLIPFAARADTEFSKFVGYARFARFAQKAIRKGAYSRVVFLQTQPAVLLSRFLLTQREFEYACDIRDYSFENSRLYFAAERRIFRNSSLNLVSSPSYRSFLPPDSTYHTLHNNHPDIPVKRLSGRRPEHVVTITYIGTIRFFEECRKFLSRFSQDERYRLRFIGAGAFRLRDTCKSIPHENVEFIDAFDSRRTLEFLRETDLIFNLYGHGTPLLDHALSNKLYYSAELGIPILVSPGTFMSTMAEEYGLGFTVDLEAQDCAESLYSRLQQEDWDSFERGRQMFLHNVDRENTRALELLAQFLSCESLDRVL